MTKILDAVDPVMECCRRVGHQLADAALAGFGTAATEAQLFSLERAVHPQNDDFMTNLNATDDQKLLAKIIIGHSFRARYSDLIRSAPAVADLRART